MVKGVASISKIINRAFSFQRSRCSWRTLRWRLAQRIAATWRWHSLAHLARHQRIA
jgi:hypothetical protein